MLSPTSYVCAARLFWRLATMLGHWPQITTPKGWKTSELLRYEYVYEVTRRARCAVNWEPLTYIVPYQLRTRYELPNALQRRRGRDRRQGTLCSTPTGPHSWGGVHSGPLLGPTRTSRTHAGCLTTGAC